LHAHDVLAQYEALAQVFALLEAAVVVAGAADVGVAAEFVHCPACFNVVPLSQQYASGV